MTQFFDQVIIRLISQLIKDISRALQKSLTNFNGTAIFAFIISLLLVFTKNLALNLNALELVSKLIHLCDVDINFQLFMNNYHYVLLNYTLALQYRDLLHYQLAYCLFQLYF